VIQCEFRPLDYPEMLVVPVEVCSYLEAELQYCCHLFWKWVI
jgi:hypothetical protein